MNHGICCSRLLAIFVYTLLGIALPVVNLGVRFVAYPVTAPHMERSCACVLNSLITKKTIGHYKKQAWTQCQKRNV